MSREKMLSSIHYVDTLGTTLEGLAALEAFCIEHPHENAWSMVIQDAELVGEEAVTVYSYHPRFSQPCYGEMRTYGKGTVPAARAVDPRPGDLFSPFPKSGCPVLICVPFANHSLTNEETSRVIELLYAPDSPWQDVLKDFEILERNGRPTGVVIWDTNIDPTAMVSLFMFTRNALGDCAEDMKRWLKLIEERPDDDVYALLFSVLVYRRYTQWGTTNELISFQTNWEYFFNIYRTSVRAFVDADIDPEISGGSPFILRAAYNRPKLGNIFKQDGDKLQDRLIRVGAFTADDIAASGHVAVSFETAIIDGIVKLSKE